MKNIFDDELVNLIKLQGALDHARQLVQMEGLLGGHGGDVDSYLTSCANILYDEIEKRK